MSDPMEQYKVINLENELKTKDALIRELVTTLELLHGRCECQNEDETCQYLQLLRRAQAAMKGETK